MRLRTIIAGAALALAVAPAAAVADSQTADLFAARDVCGTGDNARLSFDMGAYTDACGSVVQPAIATTASFPSGTLKPLWSLDPARKVAQAKGELYLNLPGPQVAAQ